MAAQHIEQRETIVPSMQRQFAPRGRGQQADSDRQEEHETTGEDSNHHHAQMIKERPVHRYVNMEPFEQESIPSRTLATDLDDIDEENEEPRGDHDEEGEEEEAAAAAKCDHHQAPAERNCPKHNYVNAGDAQDQHLNRIQQLNLLRDLLRIERTNTENGRANNRAMRRYLQQLQMDYLKQQGDLVEALEFSHKLKARKNSQIATIEETVREKDALIGQLRSSLANLDETKLRLEFESNLEKQKQLARLEQDQLRQQVNTMEQQLARERADQLQVSREVQDKMADQQRLHDKELAAMCCRSRETQAELDRLLNEPQNLVTKALKEEKAALECRLDELNIVSQELQTKYDNLRRRQELLVDEQQQVDQRNQEELAQLQEQHAEQRRSLSELKLELADKQEIIQILQFNLQRSEKRVKSLLGVMRNKEEAYRGMVAQMELSHQQELERARNEHQSAERQLIASGGDLGRQQNEIVRMRLEHENQLESLRNDRDERLNRATLDRQNLERELKATELRLAREIEQAGNKTRLIQQLHGEVRQFREEGKRLSIELAKSEAKLYAKQQDLDQALEQVRSQRATNRTEACDANKLQQATSELEEERRLSRKLNSNIDELKKDNGKLNVKLRIAEANLDRMTAAINREHNKMVREYEKRLEQIRSEQATFDKNKMRYRRYSHKLKKYCEHLRRVHEHLCNPTVCGYILGPLRAPAATSPLSSSLSREAQNGGKKLDHCDKTSLPSNEDESECDCSCLVDDLAEEGLSNHSNRHSTDNGYATLKSNQKMSPSGADPRRFVVKRTGLSPIPKRTPSLRSRKSTFKQSNGTNCPRVPLKSRDSNVFNQCDSTGFLNEHEYYYINEEHSFGDKLFAGQNEPYHRAVI